MNNDEWIKQILNSFEHKLDKIDQKMDAMESRHIENSQQLSEHIYRTELAEENIAILREQIKPIEKHVSMLHGVLKFIGIVATLVSITTGVMKILGYF
jgi:hypothetical protein